MGRLTLNVLLSFAQFEREVTGERIRDKIAASKKKGMWMGGVVPLGYDLLDHQLIVNPVEADRVKRDLQSVPVRKDVFRACRAISRGTASAVRRVSANRASRRVATLFRVEHSTGCCKIGPTSARSCIKPPRIQASMLPSSIRSCGIGCRLKFKANVQAERTRPRATEKSLLTELLFDEDGNRFTPSHSHKKGRRYRYYITHAFNKKRKTSGSGRGD